MDLLARAKGKKYTTHDVVGVGPRLVTGILEYSGLNSALETYERIISEPYILEEYSIIFLSAMSTDKGALENILRKIREHNREAIVFLGGPVSVEYYSLLKDYSDKIDYIVVGEAENTLYKLFTEYASEVVSRDYSSLTSVKGLAFRDRDRTVFTGFPPYTSYKELNTIKPYTRIDRVYKKPWTYRIYVEVLRGCSNYCRPRISLRRKGKCIECGKCISQNLIDRLYCPKGIPPGCGFCSVPLFFGPPRTRSIEAIVEEIRELIRHGARRIVLSAPDFLDYGREFSVWPKPLTNPCQPPSVNYSALELLFERIHEIPEVYSGEVIVSIENIKACLVDEKIARILGKYVKNTTVHIGLETCSDNYNYRVLGKPISRASVYRAVELLRKHGLRPYVYLVYGLPYMSRNVYLETIKRTRELYSLGVEKITLYKFIPLPLTAFEFHKPGLEYKTEINRLKRVVARYNILAKKKYFLNKTVKAYIVYSHGRLYGYPVNHGPVIFVKNKYGDKARELDGALASVRVVGVRERYVIGEIKGVIKRYK